jgi:hypothetical protein
MLCTDRIQNLTNLYPKLSRVWFKSADPKTPLKSMWIDESALQNCGESLESETSEVTEDHLRPVG